MTRWASGLPLEIGRLGGRAVGNDDRRLVVVFVLGRPWLFESPHLQFKEKGNKKNNRFYLPSTTIIRRTPNNDREN